MHDEYIPRDCRGCGQLILIRPDDVRKARWVFCSVPCAKASRMQRPFVPLAARFWARVRQTDGCWLWEGRRLHFGHGALKVQRRSGTFKSVRAHRVAWELHHGPIPAGLFVCHRCDNPICVRPDHLFLGTARDNAVDMRLKGRAAKGASQHLARLTAPRVIEMRARFAAGGVSKMDLARAYGVSHKTIRAVLSRETWRHL